MFLVAVLGAALLGPLIHWLVGGYLRHALVLGFAIGLCGGAIVSALRRGGSEDRDAPPITIAEFHDSGARFDPWLDNGRFPAEALREPYIDLRFGGEDAVADPPPPPPPRENVSAPPR